MGKIKVRGYAQEKVEVDKCEYNICFECTNSLQEDAIKRVNDNCELFLTKLKESGVDLKDIRLTGDDISDSYYQKNKKSYSRCISYTSDASVKTNNFILNLIKDNKIVADVRTNYFYSKKEELHKELLRRAVEDSRENAEIIALANNNKVISIDYLTFDRYDYDDVLIEDRNVCMPNSVGCISDELSNSLEVESEELYITWNIE